MTAGTVTLDSFEVDLPGPVPRARVFRAGRGRPLLFLHGGTGIGAQDPLVKQFATRFEVFAPIHPGFRDLEDTQDLPTVHDLALYHDDLLTALGLESPVVVGHSFGGMVAAELASHVPQRIGALVLAAPLGLWRDDEPGEDLFAALPTKLLHLSWADVRSPAAVESMAAVAAGIEGDEDVDDPMIRIVLATMRGLATVGKYLWPIPDKGLRRRLYRVTAPTLLVWGALDQIVPVSYADDYATLIGGAKTEVFDDAAHMAPYERAGAFADVVSGFAS